MFTLMNKIGDFRRWLNGKKTVTGAISLVLWVFIYAMPAFGDYNHLTHVGISIRDFLIANNVHLDNSLFNIGSGLTVIGMLDKIRRMFNDKDDTQEELERFKDMQRQLISANQFLGQNVETNRSKN